MSSTGLCIQRVDNTHEDGNVFEEQSVSMQENKRNFSEVYMPTVELLTVDFEPSPSDQTTKVIKSNKPIKDSKTRFQ